MDAATIRPGPGETLDRLAGDWRIFQLRRGHRFNTDDLLIAWTAVAAAPAARRVADLGAGVGSVGLLTLQRLDATARLVAVEVQPVSNSLLRKTIAFNGLGGRVEPRLGDLRQPDAFAAGERFELITANPPYIPEGKGLRPPHPQRAAARLELHGDAFDYCRVASRHLARGGRFCFCHAAGDPRPEQAVSAAGMRLLRRQDVVFRHGRPPVIALFTCARADDTLLERRDRPPLTVRGDDGRWTRPFLHLRREMAIDAP